MDGEAIVTPDGVRVAPKLRVPGAFNVSNAACALAAAVELGVEVEAALRGMRTVVSPAGRFATATLNGTTARLLLAKNPAGWSESLSLVDKHAAGVVVNLASRNHMVKIALLMRRHRLRPVGVVEISLLLQALVARTRGLIILVLVVRRRLFGVVPTLLVTPLLFVGGPHFLAHVVNGVDFPSQLVFEKKEVQPETSD